MIARKCIAIENGLIAILGGVPENNPDYQKLNSEDISIGLTEYGLAVTVKDSIIPVPEAILEQLIMHGNIYLYAGDVDDYQQRLICSVNLSRDVLLEAKGAYVFAKNRRRG